MYLYAFRCLVDMILKVILFTCDKLHLEIFYINLKILCFQAMNIKKKNHSFKTRPVLISIQIWFRLTTGMGITHIY